MCVKVGVAVCSKFNIICVKKNVGDERHVSKVQGMHVHVFIYADKSIKTGFCCCKCCCMYTIFCVLKLKSVHQYIIKERSLFVVLIYKNLISILNRESDIWSYCSWKILESRVIKPCRMNYKIHDIILGVHCSIYQFVSILIL